MTRLVFTAVLVLVGACAPAEQPAAPTPDAPARAARQSTAPLLGGTVTAASGGQFAVVSDPERDLIYIVDVAGRSIRGTLRLAKGSQPTRGAEDGKGNVRVVLRGTGEIATVALGSASLLRTEAVCPEPRGIAWNASTNAMVVACASGELVTLPAQGSISARRLDTDLRDVVVTNGRVRVSTFRAAELLDVGDSVRRTTLPSIELGAVRGSSTAFTPQVAWRTVAGPADLTLTVHQRAVSGDIDGIRLGLPPVAVPYYTNPCGNAIVRSAVTVADEHRVLSSIEIPGVLPVDLAISPDGAEVAVAGAGNSELVRFKFDRAMSGTSGGICGPIARSPNPPDALGRPSETIGQPVGLAFVADGQLLVHSRSPARLSFLPALNAPAPTSMNTKPTVIDLEGVDEPEVAGFRLFHGSAGGLSCASCHPEGQEDGHVWTFFDQRRRTPTLAGGITQTAPFHWKGEIPDLDTVVDDTFVSRMGGSPQAPDEIVALGAMLDTIKSLRAPTRAAAIDVPMGRGAFERAGCAECHAGELLTNNRSADVGTGAVFQVPSLRGLARRAPYMHDGCAKTVADAFDPACAGRKHGNVEALTATERAALSDYLGQL